MRIGIQTKGRLRPIVMINTAVCAVLLMNACTLSTPQEQIDENTPVPIISANGDYAPSAGEYNLSESYPGLSEDNIFRAADAEATFRFIEHGTGILMLGFPECPWCQKYLPMIEEMAEERGIDKIVYYDVRKSRLEDPDSYAKLLELLGGEDGYPQYNPDGELRIFVPFTAFIDHGEVKFSDDETCNLNASEISPEEYWDEEHISAFRDKMSKPLDDIAEAMKNCTACTE